MNLVGKEVGPFYILEEVRRGRATCLFRAVDRRSGREVALSVLAPNFAHSRHAAQSFVQAGQRAMRWRHSHIWPVIDADQVADPLLDPAGVTPYIAQTWIDGETVAARMRRIGGPAPVDVTAGVVDQVSEALTHLHAQGVAHGALNPTNVFLTRDGQALLTNVALPAAARRISLVPGGDVPDLLAFLAPEQLRGEPTPGPAVDLYSLSAVAYFLLAGRPPFTADSAPALLRQTVDEPPTPIEALRPDVPFDAAYVLTRGLHKNPSRRFQSAHELAQALTEIAAQPHGAQGRYTNGRHTSDHQTNGHGPNGNHASAEPDPSQSATGSPANLVGDGQPHQPAARAAATARPRRAARRGRRRWRGRATGRRLVFNVVVTLFNLALIGLVILMLAAPAWSPFRSGRAGGDELDRFTMTPVNPALVESRVVPAAAPDATATPNRAVLPPDVPEQAAPEQETSDPSTQ